jgi:methylmalonyl-CoA/ethylmalonyl-CoA epimerase
MGESPEAGAFEVESFDHVGILTEDLDRVRYVFGDLLGCQIDGPHLEAELGIEVLWVQVGGVDLEFITPVDEKSRAAELIAENVIGVHHVAVSVNDLDGAIAAIRGGGLQTVGDQPRPGARDTRIAFLEPDSTASTLIELVEHSRPRKESNR